MAGVIVAGIANSTQRGQLLRHCFNPRRRWPSCRYGYAPAVRLGMTGAALAFTKTRHGM